MHCIPSLLAALLLLSGCTQTTLQQKAISSTYQTGNLQLTETLLSKQINTQMPGKAYWRSRDAVVLLLNRATTRFVEGQTACAIADYDLAIDALDYYGQDSTIESAGKLLLSDTCGAYRGSDLEQVLARVYFALALMHDRDINNALATLRQAESLQQRFVEYNAHNPCLATISCGYNPLAKYLLAVLSEYQGDRSNADILFNQVEAISRSLSIPCLHIDQLQESPNNATLLCVCHNGNIPFKISDTCTGSVASAAALEILLCTHGIDPAVSSLTGIPIPSLCQNIYSEPLPFQLEIDSALMPLSYHFDVASAAYSELEQKKPLIVARGIARFLMRRTAVGYAQERDECLGSLVDLGMFLINSQTKADTRSWNTLPSTIDISRVSLTPGCHHLTMTFQRPDLPPIQQTVDIKLNDRDLCVINLFMIHPGVIKILVPSHFTQ